MISRVDILLNKGREVGLAKTFSDTSGIQTAFLLEQLNQAEDNLQTSIVNELTKAFVAFKEVSCSSTAQIAVPSDIFAQGYVHGVEYSASGSAADYQALEILHERDLETEGTPYYYLVLGDYIYLDRAPTAGKVRIQYEKTLDNFDVRRAQVSGFSPGVGSPTSIIIDDGSTYMTPDDLISTGTYEYICLNDRLGNVVMRNIPISSYDSTTRTFSVESGFVIDTGETIAIGNYVTIGHNTTTHPKGPDCFEQYYVEYLRWEVLKIRSSLDSTESNQKLKDILASIIETYHNLPMGVNPVPETRRML